MVCFCLSLMFKWAVCWLLRDSISAERERREASRRMIIALAASRSVLKKGQSSD